MTRQPQIPPQDLDAEAAVLSAIMLDAEALTEVLAILKPAHFYSEANRFIFEACAHLAAKNHPVDLVTVTSRLRDIQRIQQVGGSKYLAQICDLTPAVTNVAAHARIVAEKAQLRQAQAVCYKYAAEGYSDVGETKDWLLSLEQATHDVARGQDRSTSSRLYTVLTEAFTELEAAAKRGDTITGISTGYADLDRLIAGLHAGDLYIIAGRPGMAKSALVLNVSVHIASNTEQPRLPKGIAFYSLEMPKEQLAKRMLCTEARVDLSALRRGTLSTEDWANLAAASGPLSLLPILIDDTPALSLLELRARVRRDKLDLERHDERLAAVVVDYLQLMQGPKNAGSRELEISAISRGLKALAKEQEIAVIAVAQLNRGVETRGGKDKRPLLSDLRECLPKNTWLPDPVTGRRVSVQEARHVYTACPDLVVSSAKAVAVWETGSMAVFRVSTKTGRSICCTSGHRFLTTKGYRRLEDISIGETVALTRLIHAPLEPSNPFSCDELRLIGYLVSDGSYTKHRSPSYVKADPVLIDDVKRIVTGRFGVPVKDKPCKGIARQIEMRMNRTGPNKNPLIQWLKEIGIHGQKGPNKVLPESVFESSNYRLAVMLGALWAGDGTVKHRQNCPGGMLKFTNTSENLIDQVMWCLMRFGIVGQKLGPYRNTKSTMDLWEVVISNWKDIATFRCVVPIPGGKGVRLRKLKAPQQPNNQVGRLPLWVTSRVKELKEQEGLSWQELGYRCQGKRMCQDDLDRTLYRLGVSCEETRNLRPLANPAILWDDIAKVEAVGKAECYDLTVPPFANYVAQGFVTHNSGAIEQDADTVIFIYRDEYYHADTTDERGIAELIVGKQRNGPTGVVKLRFTGRYTRFDNLASERWVGDDYMEQKT